MTLNKWNTILCDKIRSFLLLNLKRLGIREVNFFEKKRRRFSVMRFLGIGFIESKNHDLLKNCLKPEANKKIQ